MLEKMPGRQMDLQRKTWVSGAGHEALEKRDRG